jgi:SAM-dependent methyltransferase
VAARNPQCPFCGGNSRAALTAWDRNKEITDQRFTYNRCELCRTVFLVNVPDDLARYYGGSYYGWNADGEPPSRTDSFLREVESYRVRLLRQYVEPAAMIEIGSGTGGFAAASKEAGFDVTAIEMDARCCDYLADRIGVNARQSNQPVKVLRTLPLVRVVAMWHVLEHMADPAEVLAAAADRLEPGGVIAIGVPNPCSIQFRLLRSRWTHLDAPRHLCLIPGQTLIEHARGLGLRPLRLTTTDPFGKHCNLHGWSYGFAHRPGDGPKSTKTRLGASITRLMEPIERRGENGSALLLILGKPDCG